MTETEWLSYTGAITGVIGTLTGIGGAIMGYISYRRSGQLKALDLRLELRKADHDLRDTVKGLGPLLDRAMKSRRSILAAIGQYNSGAHDQWVSEWEQTQKEVRVLEENLPDLDTDHKDLGASALETNLVTVHATQSKAAQIRDRYSTYLESDDKEREHHRAAQRESVNRGH